MTILPTPWHRAPGGHGPELRLCGDGHVEVRNSRFTGDDEPFLAFHPAEWERFALALKAGMFDDLAGEPEPSPGAVEAGPGLALVMARTRLTRAVLATLSGPLDMTASYAGSEKAAADYAELAEAARALVAAEAGWQAAIEQRAKGLAS
jgi:hypothetical protein